MHYHIIAVPMALNLAGLGNVSSAMWQPVAERLRAKLALVEASQLVAAAAPAASAASSLSQAVPTGQMVAAGSSDAVACAPRPPRRRKFSEDEYQQMSHTVLIDLLLQREAHIDDLSRNLRQCKKNISQMKRQKSQMQLQQCRAQNTDAIIFSIDRKNSCELSHLSIRGIMSVSLRRNMGNVSGKDFGAVVMENISGQTVNKCEVVMGGCLTALAQAWHGTMESATVPETADTVDYGIVVAHAYRSDATTSDVHLGAKLHNTELLSAYLLGVKDVVDPRSFSERVFARSSFLETQRVHDASAQGTCELLAKQLSQVGCPPPPRPWDHAGVDLSKAVRVYLYTSDGGSDQQKYKRVVAAQMLHSTPNIMWITCSCVFHIYQLICNTRCRSLTIGRREL